MLRDIHPSVVFFIETKLSATRMATVRAQCGFSNGFDMKSDGKGEGLSMGWKNKCKFFLHSYSLRHINVMVEDDGEGNAWRCIGFYRTLCDS